MIHGTLRPSSVWRGYAADHRGFRNRRRGLRVHRQQPRGAGHTGRRGLARAGDRRGAGIICPWTAAVDDPAWYGFARAAARQYPALIADLEERGEADVSYARVGALLAGDHDQLEQARQRLTARRAAAPEMGEVALLDDRQARELFPPLRAGAAALFIPGAARVDGRRLAAALTRAATRLGATTRTGEAKLAYRVSRVTGVTVDGELIEADAVVVAAGAWTAPLLAPQQPAASHVCITWTPTT